MFKLIAGSVVGCLLLSGGISSAQVANATTTAIDIYDGFETAGLSKVWDTDRFEHGAVVMQTNIFRAGHGAQKLRFGPVINLKRESKAAKTANGTNCWKQKS